MSLSLSILSLALICVCVCVCVCCHRLQYCGSSVTARARDGLLTITCSPGSAPLVLYLLYSYNRAKSISLAYLTTPYNYNTVYSSPTCILPLTATVTSYPILYIPSYQTLLYTRNLSTIFLTHTLWWRYDGSILRHFQGVGRRTPR